MSLGSIEIILIVAVIALLVLAVRWIVLRTTNRRSP